MRRTSVSTSSHGADFRGRAGPASWAAHASAREIEGAKTGGLGEACGVGVDGSGDLERLFFRDGKAKAGSGREGVGEVSHASSLGGIITGGQPGFCLGRRWFSSHNGFATGAAGATIVGFGPAS